MIRDIETAVNQGRYTPDPDCPLDIKISIDGFSIPRGDNTLIKLSSVSIDLLLYPILPPVYTLTIRNTSSLAG